MACWRKKIFIEDQGRKYLGFSFCPFFFVHLKCGKWIMYTIHYYWWRGSFSHTHTNTHAYINIMLNSRIENWKKRHMTYLLLITHTHTHTRRNSDNIGIYFSWWNITTTTIGGGQKRKEVANYYYYYKRLIIM